MKVTHTRSGVLAVALAITLAGCAASPGSETPDAPVPTPSASAFPMPDLGPSPAPAAITEEGIEQLRLQSVDDQWTHVLERFPDAVRPDTPFAGYLADDERLQAVRGCLEDHNVPITEGRSGPERGAPVISVGPDAQTTVEAVDGFICLTMYPHRPVAPPTDAQLGYIYDYLTEFIVPCYRATGVALTNDAAPPTREYFIANWPSQNWFPSPDMPMEDPAERNRINAACPPAK